MTEIFIENQRLELYRDLAAEFTYSIDDIKDFSSRNTSYSKTIVIPGNATNNKLFGHVFEFGSANPYDPSESNVEYNYNASRSAACLVFIDQVQVFKGILRLMEIVIDNGTIEYECAVFGELGGFIDAIGNSRLEDLDFSSYDHHWTAANISASWDNVSGEGYYYPLIDYGKVSTNKKDYDVNALRPALYVREYMNKIISGSGYTYESSFFDTDLFKRLVIPQNGKYLLKTSSNPLYATLSTTKTLLTSTGVNIRDLRWDSTVLANMSEDTIKTTFTYTGTTTLNVIIDLSLYGYLQSYQPVYIRLYKNGSAIYTSAQTSGLGSFSRPYRVLTSLSTTLAQNDVIRVEYTTTTTSNPTFLVDARDGYLTITGTTAEIVPANYGDLIDINTNIPRGIFQRDFFTSIVKLFNLYVLEDSAKPKHLVIKPYFEYYEGDGNVLLDVNDFGESLLVNDTERLLLEEGGGFNYLDWSYKVDRSKPMRLKPMSELNGRYFEFKYKPDIDYYNEQYQKKYSQGYGDRIEDTGYEFAKDKQTAEVIFSATPLVGYVGESKLVPTVFKLNNNAEDRTEHNIRILQARKITGVASWLLKNGTTTVATLTSYGFAGHIDHPATPQSDLNFGAPKELYYTTNDYPSANLFNGFWSEYVAEITDKDSKLLTCYLHLKESDIYSLNFAKLIYIDGALWRLNTVEDYNGQDVTKCTFLRVLNTNYA